MRILPFLLFALSYANIEDCSKGKSFLQLKSLDLIPSLPAVDEPVTMIVQFINPGADITNGTVTSAVTYNFLPLKPLVEDLCVNTPCPITSGFNDRSTNSTWPDVKGTIVSTITWTAFDNTQLLCFKVTLKTAQSKLRGNTDNSGIVLFKDNGMGYCPHIDVLGKKLVIYRQWDKTKRTNSSRNPEDL